MRAACYLRVSTEDQQQAGTVENQRTYAESYCRMQGLTIAGWYADEAVSGALPLEQRAEGRRLLADARSGAFDLVLVYRIDRFSRSALELLRAVETLESHRVALRSMSEPFDTSTPLGKCLLTILGSFAELEKATIRERMMLGAARVARQGRWGGGRIAYGYRAAEDGSLEIVESEAAVVRRIYALHAEGLTCSAIARLLNAEKVPTWADQRGTVTSKGWSTQSVVGILRNPTYRGGRPFRAHETTHRDGKTSTRKRSAEEIIEGPAPALVTEKQWQAAQERLRSAPTWNRHRLREYPLAGLIRCGCCGGTMTGTLKAARYPYYRCGRGGSGKGCRLIPAEALEAHVWEQVREFAQAPELLGERMAARLQEHVPAEEQAERETVALEAAITDREQDRQRAIRLATRGVITEADAEEQLREIDGELLTLRARMGVLLSREEQLCTWRARVVTAEVALRQLRERIDGAGPSEQRGLIAAVVNRILIEWREGEATPEVTVTWCFEKPEPGRTVTNSKEFMFVSQNRLELPGRGQRQPRDC